MKRPTSPQIAVGLLMIAYIATFGMLSLRRHQNLNTNALDLGYTDQAVWNTLHGRPFRFSTYLHAAFGLDIPFQDFREPGMLLAYHVEPLLVPISLLYLIYDGPETLLWLQTIGIALGAIPAYLLSRHRLERQGPEVESRFTYQVTRWLPVAFVALYYLSPSLEAANLSDFHAVSLSPALLLAAFYCLETDRPWGFVAFGFLATMCKEEIGLLVAMMGLWAAMVRHRWVLGLAMFFMAAGWSLLCFLVITPYYNGLTSSAFLVRYGQFGDSPADILRTLVGQPGIFVEWLSRADVLRYPWDLLLSSGGLAVLYPLSLLMALPLLAINTFSGYDWMRSGGGHYSAAIVPFLLIAAIYGVDGVARALDRWAQNRWGAENRNVYGAVALILVGLGLGIALIHHHQNGISPLSRRFAWEPVSEHARRAQPLFDVVNNLPPEVTIAASSSLYPHVGHRERAYLFPTVSDAQFLLVDVTGPGTPIGTGDQRVIVRDLLDYGQFGVAASDHGILLLERDLEEYRLSPSFYDVFLEETPAPEVVVGADFGGLLRLEGIGWTVRPVVRPDLVHQITTYWRALAPLEEELRLVFYFWDEQRQLVYVRPEEQVVHWYPTWLWEPGQVVKVTLPPIPLGKLSYAGVAVLRAGADDVDAGGRVVPITSASGGSPTLWEQDTVLELEIP